MIDVHFQCGNRRSNQQVSSVWECTIYLGLLYCFLSRIGKYQIENLRFHVSLHAKLDPLEQHSVSLVVNVIGLQHSIYLDFHKDNELFVCHCHRLLLWNNNFDVKSEFSHIGFQKACSQMRISNFIQISRSPQVFLIFPKSSESLAHDLFTVVVHRHFQKLRILLKKDQLLWTLRLWNRLILFNLLQLVDLPVPMLNLLLHLLLYLELVDANCLAQGGVLFGEIVHQVFIA